MSDPKEWITIENHEQARELFGAGSWLEKVPLPCELKLYGAKLAEYRYPSSAATGQPDPRPNASRPIVDLMTRAVLYVAAPLRPSEEEIAAVKVIHGQGPQTDTSKLRVAQATESNAYRAMRWLSWLRRSFPETTFIAPWIVDILSGADDSDPVQREAGMQGNFAVIERCDGIVLCGPRISEGMRREMEHGRSLDLGTFHHRDFEVYDLTRWGMRLYRGNAPEDRPLGHTWNSMCDLNCAEWQFR